MSMLILIYFGVVLILAMTYLMSLKPSKLKKRLKSLKKLVSPLTSLFESKKRQKIYK